MMYSLYDSENRKIMSEMKTRFTILYDFHPVVWANNQNVLSNKENVKNLTKGTFCNLEIHFFVSQYKTK